MRRSSVAKRGTGSIVALIAGLALLGMLVVPQAGADDFLGLPETSVNSLLNPEELKSFDAFGDPLIEVRIVSSVMPIPAGSIVGVGGETAEIIFTFGNTVAPGTFRAVLDSAQPGKDKRELDYEMLPDSEAMPFGGVRVFVDLVTSGRNLMVATVFGNKPGSQGRARDQDRTTLLCCVGNDEQGPVADAGPDQFVITGDTVTLNGGGSFDPNFDSLTYEWEQLSGLPVTLSDAGSRMPTFSSPNVPINQTVVLEFALSVNDGIWTSLPDTVRVNVLGANQAPTCVASANPTVVDAGEIVTLDGSASSDPEGSPVDCAWSQDAGTPVVLVPEPPSCIVEFEAPLVSADEELTFTLAVTDTLGASCTGSATVTVKQPNQPPVADAGTDKTVVEGDLVFLDGTGSHDPDSGPEPLGFSWLQSAGCAIGELFGADTATPSFRAPSLFLCFQTQIVPEPALLTFELTVSDGVGVGTDTVDVLVTASTGTTGLTATALSVERVRPTR